MDIQFTQLVLPETGSIVILVADNGIISPLAQLLDEQTQGSLSRAMKIEGFHGQSQASLTLVAPANTKLDRIIVLGVGEGSLLDVEQAADTFSHLIEPQSVINTYVAIESAQQAAHFAYGAQLSLYRFDKYRTRPELQPRCLLSSMTLGCDEPAAAQAYYLPLEAVSSGVAVTRDLIWEPANVVTTESFAEYCQTLSEHGLDIEIVNSKKMEELGMGALLGVGQGSMYESLMVLIRYQGGEDGEAPLAFLGKGVCFDSGGLSLKANASMNTMKEDMGGAATVTGLMLALAKRQAKVNAVGVLGLVENMPSDKAQRPSDVVTTMSGQTVEIMSTDAEGRLVLCDLLTYTQRFIKPKAMFDLATLTSAIIIALGEEIAGIFSNSDQLVSQLNQAAEAEGEPVWRMPMGSYFDKLLRSTIADTRNNGNKPRIGGSGVAAQYLHRFIENDTPWVHIDIAGAVWSEDGLPNKPKGPTGFGVRLLDRMVKDHYEI